MPSIDDSAPVDHHYQAQTSDTDPQFESTTDGALDDTFLRRFLTLAALKTTARLFKSIPSCIQISRHKVVKTGPNIHLAEARTMRFIAQNTSLPVPKVWCAFVHKGRTYIVMERIRGQELPRAWGQLSPESRNYCLQQLKDMIHELRSIKSSCRAVANCRGGSLRDSRLHKDCSRFGPFPDIQSFHRWLRDDIKLADCEKIENSKDRNEIRDMILKQDGPWESPVFTHGDLTPFNILVRGDRIAATIDWEFSGWYPHYWEYSSAWYGSRLALEWQSLLHNFLDIYPDELRMDATRQRWWGDF